jgi:hypothetical protein
MILAAVIALHLALIAWMVLASRTRGISGASEVAIDLVALPPIQIPRVQAERTRLEPMRTNVAVGLAPPLLASSPDRSTSAAPDGRGSAVNWSAEAHRAVRAFEIRRDHPVPSTVSVSMSWEEWVLREHHAGDRFKTESGDWIVWINANCYQVASWQSTEPAFGANPPRTVCPPKNGAARAE